MKNKPKNNSNLTNKEERELKRVMSRLGKSSQRVQFGDMSDEDKSAYFKGLSEKAIKARKKMAKNKASSSDLTH